MQAFYRYHPITNFIFFGIAIIFSMVFMNPIFLFISFMSSLGYLIYLERQKSICLLCSIIPLMILAVGINVFFNHRGSTILFYFWNGNPFTLESLYFGLASSMMILSTIFWFHSFYMIVTTDKLLHLFGKILPSSSLLLSMIFRFVPRMMNDAKQLIEGQKCLGEDETQGVFLRRVKMAGNVLSSETTLAFENAMDTATSMRMRGYHKGNRSQYHLYHMMRRDYFFLTVLMAIFILLLIGIFQGNAYYRYFPTFKIAPMNFISCGCFMLYALLLNMPLIVEMMEVVKWKRLK